MSTSLLWMFIPTFFMVSVTPGFCMTLALTLGISQGLRRTLWMMWGELLGVATVALCAVLGVSALLLTMPTLFIALQSLGALYIGYVGVQLWQARGQLAIVISGEPRQAPRWLLFQQGLWTAVANPKGWAFHMALLPPFINSQAPLWPQLIVLLSLILLLEFLCLLLYASGGQALRRWLLVPARVQRVNKATALLMVTIALWMLWQAWSSHWL